MKIYFAKHKNGSVTYCNWPIKETDAEPFAFECTEQDLKDVHDGTKDWKIEGGKLTVVASTRKADLKAAKLAAAQAKQAKRAAEKARKLELVQKITEGKATPEEQTEFVNII